MEKCVASFKWYFVGKRRNLSGLRKCIFIAEVGDNKRSFEKENNCKVSGSDKWNIIFPKKKRSEF
jgi:hypothetical protein